jgi:hypothetical protein
MEDKNESKEGLSSSMVTSKLEEEERGLGFHWTSIYIVISYTNIYYFFDASSVQC